MKLSKPKKIVLIITSVVVLALVIAVIIINIFIGSLIEGKIREALKKSDTNFEVSIKKVQKAIQDMEKQTKAQTGTPLLCL